MMPEFVNLTKVCELMGLSVDVDSLYDEFSQTREIMSKIVTDSKAQSLSVSARWQDYSKACTVSGVTPRYMFQVISAVLSTPGSNAFAAWCGQMINAEWRADRNRASVKLIKAELQVSLNFQIKYHEFYEYALADHKLLNAGGQKYYWREAKQVVNVNSTAVATAAAANDD